MAAARLTFVNSLLKCVSITQKDLLLRGQYSYFNKLKRTFASLPVEYNDKDPAPLFFSPSVQKLLKYITRPNVEKVFRKRNNKGDKYLETPEYKFMTNEELEKEIEKANVKANQLLQMPPVVKIPDEIDCVISNDPALQGHDEFRYFFTDITFGIKNSQRIITIREPDGRLHTADRETRKRLNQIYFPMDGRSLKEPSMFSDPILFQNVLMRKEYEFILDRACMQYEPDDPTFHRITGQVYQHCDENNNYDLLRSTRHFGPMTFYLAWHNSIDNLLIDLLQNGYVKEAVTVINLQRTLNPQLVAFDDSKVLAEEILSKIKPVIVLRQEENVHEDLDLEEKCINCLDNYIKNNSSKKSQQELALQTYQAYFRDKVAVIQGIKTAHGIQQ